MYVHTSPCTLFNIILTKLTSPVPNTQIPKPGDWGFHYNAVGMIPFDHPANQIDQVDIKIKDITFRSGSRHVSMSVNEVSLYFLGGDPIPYIGLDPIDPRSTT